MTDDPILSYLERVLHRPPDAAALMTLHAVASTEQFALSQWNRTLTLFSGGRVRCRNHQEVARVVAQLACASGQP